MTQQQTQTFVEPAEILSCADMGNQWKINLKWSNPEINPKGFASDSYMTKSIEDKIPFEKGHYALTVSKGKLKKPEFDGSQTWHFWLTTHAVRTPAEQDALSQDSQPQVADEGELFPTETTPQPTHFEKIQSNKDMIIFEQVIYKGAVDVVVAQINQGVTYEDVGQAILDLNNQIKAGLFSD